MISKEEMYEFASQIAGITDSDLEAYRCGGKTKMKKKSGGGNIFDDKTFTPVKNQINKNSRKKADGPAPGSIADNINKSKKVKPGSYNYRKEQEEQRIRALKERERDMKLHPKWYDKDGHYIGPEEDTNETVKQDWMKSKRKR